MQQENKGIHYIFSKTQSIEAMEKLPALQPFDEMVCTFLQSLSDEIRHDKIAKFYPDILTFGFFCRRAHLEQMKADYVCDQRLGRGLTFHIAPSNVPINFAYSLVAGLLSGNACVVRVSEKGFIQTDILAGLLEKVCQKSEELDCIGHYISLISYPKIQSITDYLSKKCDVRIIWGGDRTIDTIRRSPLPPRSIEVTFSDRYSLCVLDAKSILLEENMKKVVSDFYNDTYLFDQNACSSPRLIYWIGTQENVQKAKEKFWNMVYESLIDSYFVEPKVAVDKLVVGYKAVAERNALIIRMGNLIQRIEIKNLDMSIRDYNAPGGSFFEYQSEEVRDLFKVVDEKVQTLSYFGIEKDMLANAVTIQGARGIDRIVPLGKTADFSLIWDGYDLVKTLSRVIYQN